MTAAAIEVVTVGRSELARLIETAVRAAVADAARQPPALLTMGQLAAALGVSRSTVQRLRRQGLPTVMVVESPRFELDAAVRWLRAREGGDDGQD